MKKRFNLTLVSIIITLIIIFLLFIIGPANAFNLGLKILDNDVNKGEKISFIASTEILDQEFLNISHFILELNGPEKISCSFLPNGDIINNCKGITIDLLSFPDFGYGYGYFFGKGNLTYNITLDTSKYSVGVYKPTLFIVLNSLKFSESGNNIIIRGKVELNESCSIRGNNGDIFVEKKQFNGNNKLNFFIPQGNIKGGAGSIIGQVDRIRFVYDFKVDSIIENTPNRLVVSAKGNYRIDREKDKKEDVLIFFDKKTKQIDVLGNNIDASNMNATFVFQCKN